VIVNVLIFFAVFFASMVTEIRKPQPAKTEDVWQHHPSVTLS
jgi:hypothetical protein